MKSLHERQESESAREIERAAAEQWEANQATSPKVQAPKGAGAALGLLPASAPAKPPVLSSAAQAKSANIATPKSAKAMPKAGAAPTSSFGRGAATPASAKRTPSAKSTPQEAKGTPSAKNTPKSAPRAAPSPSARGAGAGGNAAKGPSKWSSAISPAAAPVSLRSDVSVAPASNHLPTSVAQADAAFAEAAPKDSAALGASANGGGAKAGMSPPRSGAKKIGGGGVGGAMRASPGMAWPNSGAKATQQQAGTSAGKASAAASRASPALLRLFGAAPPEEPQPAAAAVAAARAAPTSAARRANAAPTSAGAAGAKSSSKWGSAISPAAAPVSLQPEGYRSSPTRDTAPPSVAEAKTSSSSSSSSSAESGGAPARKMTAKAASLAWGASTSASQPSKATARASAKATAKATSSSHSSNNRVNLFGDSEMSPAAAPAAGQATAARPGQATAGGVATVSNASFSVDDTFAFGFGDDTVLDAVFSPTRHHSGNGEISAPRGNAAAAADGEEAGGPCATENANTEEEARRNAAREKLASGFAPPPDYPLLFSFSGGPTGADAFAMLTPQAAAAAAENPPSPASSPAARAKASAWNRAARLALEPPELAGPQWYLLQERLAADALTTARTESQQLRTALENLAQTSKSFQQRVQHSAYGGGGSAGGAKEKSAAKYAAVPQPSPFASHAHWHAENGGFAPERDDEAASTPSQLFASSTDRHPFGHNSSNPYGSSAYYGGSSGSSSRPSLYAPGSAASQYGTDNFADLDAYLNAAFAGGETPNPNGRHRGALDSHYGSTPVERLLPQSSSSPYNRSPATTTGVQGVTPPHLRPYALRGGVGDRLREIYATF